MLRKCEQVQTHLTGLSGSKDRGEGNQVEVRRGYLVSGGHLLPNNETESRIESLKRLIDEEKHQISEIEGLKRQLVALRKKRLPVETRLEQLQHNADQLMEDPFKSLAKEIESHRVSVKESLVRASMTDT